MLLFWAAVPLWCSTSFVLMMELITGSQMVQVHFELLHLDPLTALFPVPVPLYLKIHATKRAQIKY